MTLDNQFNFTLPKSEANIMKKFLWLSAMEVPGGNLNLNINNKAQQKTRKIGILKKFNISNVSSRLTTSENEYLQGYKLAYK